MEEFPQVHDGILWITAIQTIENGFKSIGSAWDLVLW